MEEKHQRRPNRRGNARFVRVTGLLLAVGAAACSATNSNGGADGGAACVSVSDFSGWATGEGPADIGKLAVSDMETHTSDSYGGDGYALAFTWYGALKFTVTTGDNTNNQILLNAFATWLNNNPLPDNSASAGVDNRAFGVLPLEVYIETQNMSDETLGLARADAQWQNIATDVRYWSDDMYMITGLQVMAYRATRNSMYLDHAATEMIIYVGMLQQSDGFFWHTLQSKAYWGRANGWVASGMTELLMELPNGSTRDSIMAAYQKEIDALLSVQISGGTDDGCWRQVLDLTSAPAETSCTAMFTYALATGVKNGWLTDPKYAAAAQRGWVALAAKTGSDGKLHQVCPGTGQAPAGTLASQQQFYATITLVDTGDLHGQAPLLWSANELLTTDCHGIRQ
jgi:rhamnogalacturonyl hydrolase YesR